MRTKIYHDELVLKLVDLIKKDYLDVITHRSYGNGKFYFGEIDVIGFRKHNLDFYEVKSDRKHRDLVAAAVQLNTARFYYGMPGDSYIYTPKYGIETVEAVMDSLDPKTLERIFRKLKNKKASYSA